MAACCVLIGVVAFRNTQSISLSELSRRVATSRPSWQSYQEDIKGQIGATPVAEWAGIPIEVNRESSGVRVVFRLSGAWATREQAMPVLLRDALGNVYRDSSAERAGDRCTYLFEIPERVGRSGMPWVEIMYPDGNQRVTLSEDGHWGKTP
jgi:hypothetical protein